MAHNYHNAQVPLGYPPTAPPRHSSLQATSTTYEPGTTRTSENSSLRSATSFDSRRSSNDSGSSKPRLSRDQNCYLESIFAGCQKPSTANKKVYAAQLNLSLEKVNNWFQNRRAKNKHELKKKGSYNLLWQKAQQPHLQNGFDPNTNMFAGPDQGWVDGTFYNPTYDPRTFVGPAAPVGPEMPPDQFTDESNPMGNGQVAYGEQEGYTHYEPSHTYGLSTSMDAFDTNFFGLGDPSQPLTSEQHLGQARFPFQTYTSMDPISEEIEEPPSIQAPHDTSRRAPPPQPQRQMEEVPSSFTLNPEDFIMPSDLPQHSQGESSIPTWGNTAYLDQQQRAQPSFTDGQHQASVVKTANLPVRDRKQTILPESTTMHLDAFAWSQSGFPRQNVSSQLDRHHHSQNDQSHLSVPVDCVESRADSAVGHNFSPVLSEGMSGQRRGSTVSNLAEHMGGVEVNGQQEHAARQSASNPNLSLRRQKRPAPLGLSTSRSTSFSHTAVPGSPRNLNSASHELRRIKSFGVQGGRVQKASASSARQSPMHASFRENEISRSISNQSMNGATTERWKAEHSIPITPSFNSEHQMPSPVSINGPGQMPGTMHPSPWNPQTQPDARVPSSGQMHGQHNQHAPLFFSHEPLNAGHYAMHQHYNSPPETPSTTFNFNHSNQVTPGSQMVTSVPSSASAYQTAFPQQNYAPYAPQMVPSYVPMHNSISSQNLVQQSGPGTQEQFYQNQNLSTSGIPQGNDVSRPRPPTMHAPQPAQFHQIGMPQQLPLEHASPPLQVPNYPPEPQYDLTPQKHFEHHPPPTVHQVRSAPHMHTPQTHAQHLHELGHSRSPSDQKTPQQATTPSQSQVTPRQHRPSYSQSKLPFSTDKPEAFNTWDSRGEKPSPQPQQKPDYHYIPWKPDQEPSPRRQSSAQYGPLVFHNSYLGERGLVGTSPTARG